MDTRASRYAMWRLHAPPSREADINPNPKKGGYPAPDRVTFLTGANRDFPNWRRHPSIRNGLCRLRDIPAILGLSDFVAALSNSTMGVQLICANSSARCISFA